MARHSHFLLLASSLAALAAARTFIDCSCSPSVRGYRNSAIQELKASRELVQKQEQEMKQQSKNDPSITDVIILQQKQRKMLERWGHCTNNFSPEECANADAALRLGDCFPNCDSFCRYNPDTWSNTVNGKVRSSCDKGPGASEEQTLIEGRAENKPAAKPRTPVRPTPPPARTAPPPPKRPAQPEQSANPPQQPGQQPQQPDQQPQQSGEQPQQAADQPGQRETRPTVSPRVTPNASAPVTSPEPLLGEGPNRNEGCVAVEHLEGYVLQHRSHLRRPVLCAHGFCATPNHAIIVAGRMTSMKVLCNKEWSCVRSVKMVNNLKLAANRRAKVNDLITVTPYDLRFPKVGVWALQMAEDALHITVASVAAAAVAVLALVFRAQVSSL